jgi:ribosome-binding factor A
MKPFEQGSRRDSDPRDPDQPDEGVDPRIFFEDTHRGRGANRKTRMLCSQVADCLQLILESGIGDEDLQEAVLHEVEPFPDAGTLRITIAIPGTEDPARVHAALGRASGYLRSEVARAISRKRAPQLVFRLIVEGTS